MLRAIDIDDLPLVKDTIPLQPTITDLLSLGVHKRFRRPSGTMLFWLTAALFGGFILKSLMKQEGRRSHGYRNHRTRVRGTFVGI